LRRVKRALDGLASSFGDAADDYERGRPGWPEEAVGHLVAQLGLEPKASVLDLGAGTGKLTRMLAERFSRAVAVEPLDSLRRRLEALAARAEVLAGTAERIPLPGGSIDAVFAGEAFHWFDGERALAEIARVLRGPGGLGLLWNVKQGAEPPLPAEVPELLERLRLEAKPPRTRYGSYEWKRAFAHSSFAELQERSFPNEVELDGEGLIANAASQSYVAVLPEERRAAVLAELRSRIEDRVYRVVFRTDVYWTRLVR
jgi:ubiquinone/menaquinone biosynthesis C-methylase UbiE